MSNELTIYEARPKGSLNERVRKSLHAAGFSWSENAWLRDGKGSRPWGCTVRKYIPPHPKDPMVSVLGILLGTHDEFGRRIKEAPDEQ